MNNRNDQQAKLLAETFQGDWDTGAPAAMAQIAARAARRRRAARHAINAAGIAAVAIAAAVFAWRRPVSPPRPAEPPRPVASARGYEILSDDELLAQIHDRPLLALKSENGTREIVVLENGSD